MWIIGVTGAQGAGKSTIAKYLKQEGIPVHCADKEIHSLLRIDAEVRDTIKTLWPEVFVKNHIDRTLLGNRVLLSPPDLKQLEETLYPKLIQRQRQFLLQEQKNKSPMVVFDVPLLIETGLDRYCDYVILVSSAYFLRKQRVLRGKNMTMEKFKAFEFLQIKDAERRKKADFVIFTGRDKGSILNKIKECLAILSQQPIPKWQGKWPRSLKRENHGTRNCFRYRNNRFRANSRSPSGGNWVY